MAGLERVPGGIRLRLGADEVDVVASLAEGLLLRLTADEPGGDARQDEVLRRLAPPASRGDAALDAELRRLLHDDLMSARVGRLTELARGLRTHGESGYDRTLERDEAMRVVEAINDLRIALAATVGYDVVAAGSLPSDDPRADTLRLLDALAWLQGGLIDFIDGAA